LVGLEPEFLGHERDDVGLRDGLLVPDAHRRVEVGEVAHVLGHEFVAAHGAHGFEYAFVGDAPRHELLFDHAEAELFVRGLVAEKSSNQEEKEGAHVGRPRGCGEFSLPLQGRRFDMITA
jgi:hypothetical protein